MQVKNAIPHPRIMGVIRECGGKMWMMESEFLPHNYRKAAFLPARTLRIPADKVAESWDKASTDLFESFRQYDESGSPQRIQVLKYLVLTYMLMGSEINPFDSQETKPCIGSLDNHIRLTNVDMQIQKRSANYGDDESCFCISDERCTACRADSER